MCRSKNVAKQQIQHNTRNDASAAALPSVNAEHIYSIELDTEASHVLDSVEDDASSGLWLTKASHHSTPKLQIAINQ